MKTIFQFLLTIFLTVGLITCAYAKSEHRQMHTKLKRGFLNIGTSPLEISNEVSDHWKATDRNVALKTAATLPAALKGVVMMGTRIGTGLWDVLTFNVPFPKNFEPVMKPEYVVDSWNTKTPFEEDRSE